MSEIVVASWLELIEQLYIDSWQPAFERFRSNYAFRGLSDKKYVLASSLLRLGGNYVDLEFHLLRNFEKYARLEQSTRFSIWDWLAIAQHHGLPTRLLDWTFSPFVAMHFATSEVHKFDSDGVVWCVDFGRLHKHLPQQFRDELSGEGSNVFTVEMLAKISPSRRSLQNFDRLSEVPFMLFFEPPSMDERIVNQFSLHSVISNPRISPDELFARYDDLYKKIIIPASLKWEVRDKLDQANINERVLFPGLDGLCKWLSRHYSPKVCRQ
ncbi:MAG: FRG domain-containing protein [Candidatus Omnitrophica bacterium]|nr:FRG domain-containing protein [Candidatus Omnitrophota bacterium]